MASGRAQETWDAWDQLIAVKALAGPGSTAGPPERLAEEHFLYSTYGRPRGTSKSLTDSAFVSTRSQFLLGGQTELVRIGATADSDANLGASTVLRTTRLERDSAGRVISQRMGEGQFSQELPASSTFGGMNVTSFLGDMPHTVETVEPIAGAAKYVTSTLFDGLGRVKQIDETNGTTSRRATTTKPATWSGPSLPGTKCRGRGATTLEAC